MMFDFMKELYEEDAYFKDAYMVHKNWEIQDTIVWLDYMIQEGLLFKKN